MVFVRTMSLRPLLAARMGTRTSRRVATTNSAAKTLFESTVTALIQSNERTAERALQRQADAFEEAQKIEMTLTSAVTSSSVCRPPRKGSVDLCVQLTACPKYTIEALRAELEARKNNLNLRSAIEIIAASLVERQKALGLPNPVRGPGVQDVIDAAVAGGFDSAGITFAASQAKVINAFAAKGGIKPQDLKRAYARLYGELLKHHHTGVTKALKIKENEQTPTEVGACMAFVMYGRDLCQSRFDIVYYDVQDNVEIPTLATL
ncbi:hypothetical protein DFH06DRAFT_1184959 [Mycena polygramma]|nr:hypothetical protein DFH06DRAFT_1184959 [Mycena polygramma]